MMKKKYLQIFAVFMIVSVLCAGSAWNQKKQEENKHANAVLLTAFKYVNERNGEAL